MRWWKFVLAYSLFISQLNTCASEVLRETEGVNFDSLLQVFGNNKNFDVGMLEPSLIALSYYPELANTRINFKHKNLPTLMAARPRLNFIFQKKENRQYVVLISNNKENQCGEIFKNMSVGSRTGILGHEFAHILEYETLTNIELLCFSIKYILKRRSIERRTDEVAITRGLGNEMLEYTIHIKGSKLSSKKYLARKRKFYLSVAEIKELINRKYNPSRTATIN